MLVIFNTTEQIKIFNQFIQWDADFVLNIENIDLNSSLNKPQVSRSGLQCNQLLHPITIKMQRWSVRKNEQLYCRVLPNNSLYLELKQEFNTRN